MSTFQTGPGNITGGFMLLWICVKKDKERLSAVCQPNMYECTLKRYFYLQRINNKRVNLKCLGVSGSMISQH